MPTLQNKRSFRKYDCIIPGLAGVMLTDRLLQPQMGSERNDNMKPPYRVQKYVRDMGVYHKHSIRDDVSNEEYNQQNVYMSAFCVILPSNDPFGKNLPEIVRTEHDRSELCRKHENMCAECQG